MLDDHRVKLALAARVSCRTPGQAGCLIELRCIDYHKVLPQKKYVPHVSRCFSAEEPCCLLLGTRRMYDLHYNMHSMKAEQRCLRARLVEKGASGPLQKLELR